MTAEAPARPVPVRFGDYELVRRFTAGGMADLDLARNPRFGDRTLILKRLQPRYRDEPAVVDLFVAEGRIGRLLAHRNVVRVFETGQRDQQWFIAMEYVDGHDLAAIATRSADTGIAMPRAIAAGLVAQVAAGLAHLHRVTDERGASLGLVHCDVSPGNVVVSPRGIAKIVDFGVARAAAFAGGSAGGVAGTYRYMAPEQVRGEPLDARADLFPLGVILHELTVGERLFAGRPEQVMRKVCEEPIPRPSELVDGYPPELERIAMRLLERDPRARHRSAAAVVRDLRGYLSRTGGGWGRRDIARFVRRLFASP